MGGADLQDCVPNWFVAPSRRRHLGVRHPVAGVSGVCLFLPFGSGPSSGRNDKCVEAVLEVARVWFPQLRVVDFVDDIRFAGASSEHDSLALEMTGFMALLEQMGARYHAKEGKRWRPTRSILRPAFVVDTRNDAARMSSFM